MSKETNKFASLSIHQTDRLRFLQFPEDIYVDAEAVITASWPPGVQAAGPYGNSYQYKLKGRPFGAMSDKEGVGCRRLIRDVLAFLRDHSWVLVTPLICNLRPDAKDTLIFRRLAPDAPLPPPVEWLVVALTRSDRLRIIYDVKNPNPLTADNDHDHLGVLVTSLKKVLEGMELLDKGEYNNDSFEFKFKGMPWNAYGEKTVTTRLMLLRLVETLDSFGWQSHAAVLQRTGTKDIRVADTWYFVRPRAEPSTMSIL
jgi:hypothetical protein